MKIYIRRLLLIFLVSMIFVILLKVSVGAFRYEDSKSDEIYMISLINRERAKKDLSPLKIDYSLIQVARDRALEIVTLGRLDHESPVSGSLGNRLLINGIGDWLSGGENLAQAPSVESAFKALMKSRSHRFNIMNPNFTHIGIGIINNGVYGKIFAQELVQYSNN
jgi:uncharacterized protein YkwD